MAGKKLLIDVYNIKTGLRELEDVSIEDAAAHMGTDLKDVYRSTNTGRIIQKNYRVHKKGYQTEINNLLYKPVPAAKHTTDTLTVGMPKTFGEEWDEIHRNSKLIKSGKAIIVPVLVKGKRKYHTVILEGAAV
jgi:hypothetical protein